MDGEFSPIGVHVSCSNSIIVFLGKKMDESMKEVYKERAKALKTASGSVPVNVP